MSEKPAPHATQFRTPTEEERAFLRIAVCGYRELEAQIETIEVADDDPLAH